MSNTTTTNTPTPTAATGTPGRGLKNNNRGRNRGGRGGTSNDSSNGVKINGTSFKGAFKEMNGHVFQLFGESVHKNQFSRTMEELEGYVGVNFKKYPEDITKMVATLQDTIIEKPKPPKLEITGKFDLVDSKIFDKEIEHYVTRLQAYKSNKCSMYALVWGQCSESMHSKLKSTPAFVKMRDTNDSLELLKTIKGISYKFEAQDNIYMAIDDAKHLYYTYVQGQDETNASYLSKFKNIVEVIQHYGGSVGDDNIFILNELKKKGLDYSTAEAKDIVEATEQAKSKAQGIAFLKRSDKGRYGLLLTELKNCYSRQKDEYPNSITEAYNLLVTYVKPPAQGRVHNINHTNNNTNNTTGPKVENSSGQNNSNSANSGSELTFTQAGVDNSGIQCYHCQQYGHFANVCTNPKVERATATSLMHTTDLNNVESTDTDSSDDEEDEDSTQHFMFQQSHEPYVEKLKSVNGVLHPDWILLDSDSTTNIFQNKDFLTNIRHCGGPGLHIITNGGFKDVHMIGDLAGFGEVWYNPTSVANILSLADVRKKFLVTMHSRTDAAFFVHKDNGQTIRFAEHTSKLYLFDASLKATGIQPNQFTFVNMVVENESLYTKRQVRDAKLARRVYIMVGRPSHATFLKMIRNNLLQNCPITVNDANNALKIYGPDLGSVRGKTVRRTPHIVHSDLIEELPKEIINSHGKVTICMDIFFVDGLAFLSTVSRGIRFVTAEYIPSRHIMKQVLPCIKHVNNLYNKRGLKIIMIHADEEFSSLRDELLTLNIDINIAATNEHVPEIERTIRTIKERNRSLVSTMPFVHYPKLFKLALITNAVTWLNMFPHTDGISNILSPRVIVTGVSANFKTHCRVPIGSYCEIHDEPSPSNTETPRTSPAIALNSTGNQQGGVYFLSLTTGKKVSRRNWTELPIDQDIIETVHDIAFAEPLYNRDIPDFQFEWGPNHLIDDLPTEDDLDPEEYVPQWDNDNNSVDSDNLDDEDDDGETNELILPADPEFFQAIIDDNQREAMEDNIMDIITEDEDGSIQDENQSEDDFVDTDVEENMDNPILLAPHKYNLRNKERDYSHRFGHALLSIDGNLSPLPPKVPKLEAMLRNHRLATGLQFSQMSVKAGIKKLGNVAIDAILDECKQLDEKDTLHPVMFRDLTKEQHQRALRAITIITEKRCGRVKGRTVADGRSQREYTNKEDSASPAVSIEGLFVLLAVNAKEKRCVSFTDVVGAYLNALMKEIVIMVYEGEMVDYMVSVNPERYSKFVHVTNSGKKLLYVRLNKALYGCVQSALLWYNLFRDTLEEFGFVVNPHDACVANKVINGNQCTVCWYVDDIMIAHIDQKVVDQVINDIEAKYGKMTVSKGLKHIYVGMDIDYSSSGEVKISMIGHIKEALNDFPEACNLLARTPAADHLFQVNEQEVLLPETKRQCFHKIVAKLLFITNRARPDILVAISFLTSRVTKANNDDWKKLHRVLCYLQHTIDLQLTLSVDDMSIMKTWVDASYATHNDMRSHTGGCIMLGKGVLYTKSSKQKLNTKSSTEAELVGASDFLSQTIWTKNFIESQGYSVDRCELLQDNTSAMKLERHGRASAGQKSRHINIRFYFIKDRIDTGEIDLIHCPTAIMVADYFTKPLQGSLFRKFRDIIMGITHFSSLTPKTPSPF